MPASRSTKPLAMISWPEPGDRPDGVGEGERSDHDVAREVARLEPLALGHVQVRLGGGRHVLLLGRWLRR
jgi:hypothetical protein